MLKGNDYRNFIENLMVPHFEVSVKNLGVIGAGSIGNQVTKVVRALGMNILVYTKTPRRWQDRDIWPVSLMELLKRMDFVSIHIPLTSEAKYLINKDNLRVIKSYSFIIKEAALIEALQNKTILGAVLDAQDSEPPKLDSPLFTMENIILTPHIGWKTLDSRQRLINIIADNISSFINGCPINVVRTN